MTYFDDGDVRLYCADALEALRELPDQSVHMACTSPPFFGLRDYGTGTWEGGDEGCDHEAGRTRTPASEVALSERAKTGVAGHVPNAWGGGDHHDETAKPSICGKCGARRIDSQIGLESSPDEWAARLVDVFREVRRVLRDDGTLWVECGDSYTSGQGGRQSNVGEMPAEALQHEAGIGTGDAGSWQSGATTKLTPGRGTTDLKPKDLIGQPWLLAFALRADGWYLRSCIIWTKPNCMPESVTDRPTTAHSYVFLFSKRPRYFYDAEALREPAEDWGGARIDGKGRSAVRAERDDANVRSFGGRADPINGKNARSVWQIPTEPNALAICRVCDAFWQGGAPREHCGQPVVQHFAAFPRELVRRMILAGSAEGDTVLDPFAGSGTTGLVARQQGRDAILIELNERYAAMCKARMSQLSLLA